MARRYNPPPSWPAPPRGWTPPEDWTAPADFPPLPEGWPLWIDDDAPAVSPDAAAAAQQATREAEATEAKRRQNRQTWTLLAVGGAIAVFVIVQGVVQLLSR